MKHIVLFIFLFAILFSRVCFSQQTLTSRALKDSVEKRFLNNGAFHYSFFSSEWQSNIDSALAITPDDDYLWQQKAMPYFKCRKYQVGMQYLDKAVALNPKENLGYRGFIKCIFSKNYADAIIDFANAITINGNKTEMEHPYSFYIGISFLQLNQYDSAINYFNKTVEAESPIGSSPIVHFMDWFYLGIANYELKNYTEAIAFFDKDLLHYSSFSEAKFYKAVCLHKLHIKKEEAMLLFEEAATDFKKGYSFTEDNCVYEKYPYQLSQYIVKYHGLSM